MTPLSSVKSTIPTRDDAPLDIGSRLRDFRLRRRLSQRELARKAGVTNGQISQIEKNHSSPSVSSLKRILDAFPVSLAEFFAKDFAREPQIFFEADEFHEISLSRILPFTTSPATISLRQVGGAARHSIQMLHECYAPGADTGARLYSHSGEEAGMVISGQIEITVGPHVGLVSAGGGYIFDSNIPHRFRNPGTEDCVMVSASTPPAF